MVPAGQFGGAFLLSVELVVGLAGRAHAIGFSVLKGSAFLADTVRALAPDQDNWSIEPDYHFGGYARKTTALRTFVADFTATHGIPLDYVYTGKMMYGIVDLAAMARNFAGRAGVYFDTFGIRSEINVFRGEHDVVVTGPRQMELVKLL